MFFGAICFQKLIKRPPPANFFGSQDPSDIDKSEYSSIWTVIHLFVRNVPLRKIPDYF